MSDRECQCPNCGVEGNHDLSQETFEEYRCGNDNCSVEVYRVGPYNTDNDGMTDT